MTLPGGYWPRSLRLFAGELVEVTFTGPDGGERRWSGRLLRPGETGPVVEHDGEARRLCAYEQVRAVAAAAARPPSQEVR